MSEHQHDWQDVGMIVTGQDAARALLRCQGCNAKAVRDFRTEFVRGEDMIDERTTWTGPVILVEAWPTSPPD